VLYIFKIVSVLTFLKIVLLIVPINFKNFANLDSTLVENWLDILQPKEINWLTWSGVSSFIIIFVLK